MDDGRILKTPNGKVMHLQDWVSLRDYVDKQFELNAVALDKAERTMNARLEGMNEFRETLKDQASRFVTRDQVELMIKPLCDDVRSLRTLADKAEGKASQNAMLGTLFISIVSLVIGIIRLVVK